MKLWIPLCAFAVLAVGTFLAVDVWAARSAAAILRKPQMQSLTAVPLFDEDGKLQSLHVTVKYLVNTLNPDGKTKQKHLWSLDMDLQVQAKQRVIVGDEIVEIGDLADDLMTLSEAVWLHRFPSPLPVPRRKALREPLTVQPQP